MDFRLSNITICSIEIDRHNRPSWHPGRDPVEQKTDNRFCPLFVREALNLCGPGYALDRAGEPLKAVGVALLAWIEAPQESRGREPTDRLSQGASSRARPNCVGHVEALVSDDL